MSRWDKKREKSKQIWMSVIIAGLMIFSVFGVLIGSQSNELRYGKFKFTQADNHYALKVGGQDITFYTLPYESELINVSDITINKLKESYFVFVAFDPNKSPDDLPAIELVRFDFSQYLGGKIIVNGVLESSEAYSSLPIVSCANATLKTPVIIFNSSSGPSVVDADNCIYLNGKGSDFLRLRDRIIYGYQGVISDASEE